MFSFSLTLDIERSKIEPVAFIDQEQQGIFWKQMSGDFLILSLPATLNNNITQTINNLLQMSLFLWERLCQVSSGCAVSLLNKRKLLPNPDRKQQIKQKDPH